MADSIALRGVRVHNLKGIDVTIPLRKLTVVTGVSGAGKSSLAFDTLYAEAQRRYLQSFSATTRQLLERFDKPDAEEIGDLPPAIAVGREGQVRNPRATVGSLTEVGDFLRLLFARAGTVHCRQCGQPAKAQRTNDVLEAVATHAPGTRLAVVFPSRPESPEETTAWAAALLEEGLFRVQVGTTVYRLGEQSLPPLGPRDKPWVLIDRVEAGRTPPERLGESIDTAFARGQGRMALLSDGQELSFDQRLACVKCDLVYPPPEPSLFDFNSPAGACPTCHGTGTAAKSADACMDCQGRRWNEQARAVRLAGRSIADLSEESLDGLSTFFQSLELPPDAQLRCGTLVEQICRRLASLTTLQLGYLSLNRPATSLSTGETRRVQLSAALGSNLVHALYVLDEPTVGLHPRDTDALLNELHRLRDAGNTLVVIEHDPAVIAAADHVIDLGPGAGEEGGQVTYQGPPAGLADVESPTGDAFSGRGVIPRPSRRRSPRGTLKLSGARLHNLKDLTVEFPLGVLCVVTGVGGAGKSSLVVETLYPALLHAKKKKGAEPAEARVTGASQIEDAILMDQEPLSRTARSNPATYLKIFDEVRELFAATTEAKVRGFGPGHFSFNQPGGRCETCEGQGMLTVEMQFLADVMMTCPECQGARYQKEILDVKVRSLSIAEVLGLTAREAFRFFRAQPGVERRLKHLLDVGLDYLRLGQPADTLSGGESQRLKLAGHLAASRKPRSLFVLREPTAGLHPADVARLLDCFDRLLETGHSLLVVEQNLDVLKCADWVIELGPGAGRAGGRVVAAGTPEEVAGSAESVIGPWLRDVLEI